MEQAVTKKDVEIVIRVLRDTPMTVATRERLAEAFTDELQYANPRLVRDRKLLTSAIMGTGIYGESNRGGWVRAT